MKTNIEKGIKYRLYHGTNENQHKKEYSKAMIIIAQTPRWSFTAVLGLLGKSGTWLGELLSTERLEDVLTFSEYGQ